MNPRLSSVILHCYTLWGILGLGYMLYCIFFCYGTFLESQVKGEQ